MVVNSYGSRLQVTDRNFLNFNQHSDNSYGYQTRYDRYYHRSSEAIPHVYNQPQQYRYRQSNLDVSEHHPSFPHLSFQSEGFDKCQLKNQCNIARSGFSSHPNRESYFDQVPLQSHSSTVPQTEMFSHQVNLKGPNFHNQYSERTNHPYSDLPINSSQNYYNKMNITANKNYWEWNNNIYPTNPGKFAYYPQGFADVLKKDPLSGYRVRNSLLNLKSVHMSLLGFSCKISITLL